MAHSAFPTVPLVSLARCVLRPYHASDLEPMCATADDPEIARYMRDAFPHPYTREDGLTWLRICNAEGLAPAEGQGADNAAQGNAPSPPPPPPLNPNLSLAISLHDGTFVGSIGLRPTGTDATDRYSREIGYWIARAHWGRGLASEVVEGLARWALSPAAGQLTSDGQPLQRIEACVYAGNAASTRVLERAGFVREGERRQAVVKNGVVLDVAIYGLIASDLDPVPRPVA